MRFFEIIGTRERHEHPGPRRARGVGLCKCTGQKSCYVIPVEDVIPPRLRRNVLHFEDEEIPQEKEVTLKSVNVNCETSSRRQHTKEACNLDRTRPLLFLVRGWETRRGKHTSKTEHMRTEFGFGLMRPQTFGRSPHCPTWRSQEVLWPKELDKEECWRAAGLELFDGLWDGWKDARLV